MKCELKGTLDMKLQGGGTVKLNDVLYVSQAAKNLLILSRLASKGATMGATKYKTTIKKNGVSMILNAIKGVNDSTMFYLKAKTFS